MKNAKDAILFAAINCSHHIEVEKITLEFYPGKPGNNALDQLSARLEVAFDACTASMTARIAELESQLADETGRLDFVLGQYAYCAKFSGCVNTLDGYQLIVSDEEVDCIAISGEDVNHPTPRAAIDAAIELAKGGE